MVNQDALLVLGAANGINLGPNLRLLVDHRPGLVNRSFITIRPISNRLRPSRFMESRSTARAIMPNIGFPGAPITLSAGTTITTIAGQCHR